jgi:hypothetical protein
VQDLGAQALSRGGGTERGEEVGLAAGAGGEEAEVGGVGGFVAEGSAPQAESGDGVYDGQLVEAASVGRAMSAAV